MNAKFDNCPSCGRTVIKGAMRCVACGSTLQTPEEQIAMIERLQSGRKFNFKGLFHYAVLIILSGIAYHYFSERIVKFINMVIRNIL